MIEKSLPSLQRSYSRIQKVQVKKELLLGHEHNTASPRMKRLSLSRVSTETRVKIARMASARIRTQKEIADLFNVRVQVVSQLSSALKRSSPMFIKRRMRELKRGQ